MSQHIYASTAAPTSPPPTSTSAPTPSSDAAPAAGPVKITSHNQYHSPPLLPSELDPSPLALFQKWFTLSLQHVAEPEAMAVSSVSASGIPSTRIVLLKTVDDRGFVFFTNYTSRKSRELADTGYASLALYWREMHRQVRAVGRVEKVSRAESEEYFQSRPRGSRVGAWASRQSEPVGEGELQERVEEIEKRFEGGEVECPEGWGGWRIVPFEVEFWQGQPSRLHDRFRYTRPMDGEGEQWTIDRLAP